MACGHCIYKMEGLEGCTPACKVDDKVVLLEAAAFDGAALMAAGGCEAAITATAEGKVEGDKFVATSLTLK